jgi:hypothetical protein
VPIYIIQKKAQYWRHAEENGGLWRIKRTMKKSRIQTSIIMLSKIM